MKQRTTEPKKKKKKKTQNKFKHNNKYNTYNMTMIQSIMEN